MKLTPNECANCRRVIGYVVTGTLKLPTLCILCVGDKDVLKEWGHAVDRSEKPIMDILREYRSSLNRMDLQKGGAQ